MSVLRATTISDLAGTGPVTLTGQSAAKAWVTHNGSAAINTSFNVSTVTDNGVGIFDANFTSNLDNALYPHVSINNTVRHWSYIGSRSVSYYQTRFYNEGALDFGDPSFATSVVFGDLA